MTSQKHQESNARKNALSAGIFFIAASTTAILGFRLYDPILNHPQNLVEGYQNANQILLGVIFELVLACSAIGTAISLFPYLQKFNKTLGIGYVCFRTLEVVLILIGIVGVLSLLSLARESATNPGLDSRAFQTLNVVLKDIYRWAFLLGPHFMLGVNTFLYSLVFYRSKLIPRKLAAMGLTGAVLVFIVAIFRIFNLTEHLSVWHISLTMPIALYEMILAVWLITKGFNRHSLVALTAQNSN